MGPGQYFIIDPNNKEYKDADFEKEAPFGVKDVRKNTFLLLDNTKFNPGPGEYECQSFTNNAENEINSDVNKQFFISGERFNDKYVMRDLYSNPGPGYYEPKIESISLNNEKKFYRNKDNILFNFYKTKRKKVKRLKKLENNQFVNGVNASVEEFKYKEEIPPVGYYFPEFFNTIDYKNKKKILDAKQEGVSFSRTISNGLKKSSSTSDLLGPGYYNINRDNRKNIYFQVNPPFHSSSKRIQFPIKQEKYKLNADDYKTYYMKEFFNWNKKSYNVNFI